MDARRALEVLGLSSPTSKEGLKRAYLKAVRAHAPERDPDGFAEVRAAYEFLLDTRCIRPSSPPDSESEPPAPHSARAEQAPPSWRTRAAPSPPTRPSSAPRPPVPSPVDGFVQLLAAADFGAAARQLMRLWAEQSGIAAAPLDVLTCILRLFEARDFILALELLRSFDAETERAGVRASELETDVIARWMLVGELATLPGQAGDDLIAALAAAVRSGRYRRAGHLLDRAIAADESLCARLKTFAPALLAATQRAGSAELPSLRPALSTVPGPP